MPALRLGAGTIDRTLADMAADQAGIRRMSRDEVAFVRGDERGLGGRHVVSNGRGA